MPNLLALRNMGIRIPRHKSRLCMKVWIRDFKTQGACDTFLSFVIGRYNEVGIFAIDDGVSPKEWGGTSTLGRSNATLINGKTPWAYLYDALHANGIKVIAWIWITHFAYWGGSLGVDVDIPDNATYNDAGIYNMHDATARTTLVTEIKDFVDNNGMEALVFNQEGTTANIVASDLDAFVTELRQRIPYKEMAWHTAARVGIDEAMKISTGNWLRDKLIDHLYLMTYATFYMGEFEIWLNSIGLNMNDPRIAFGLTSEDVFSRPSDYRHRWLLAMKDGYRSFFHFTWSNDHRDTSSYRSATDEFLGNSISAIQPPITKVSITSGTSWTITVDGSDQTTTYASVSDHLYSGPLKQHIEAAIGSENPAIQYSRNNSTLTYITLGDYM